MSDMLVWVIALPLMGALLSVMLPRSASIIGVVTALATLSAAAAVLWLVASEGVVGYAIGGWSPGLGIALRADGLSDAWLTRSYVDLQAFSDLNAINSYLIALRMFAATGELNPHDGQRVVERLRDQIGARADAHLKAFLAAWVGD